MHIYANNASSDYKAEASNFAAELALKDIQSIVSELNSLYSKISTIELFKETILVRNRKLRIENVRTANRC